MPCRIAESAARAAQYRAIYHHKEEYEVKAMCKFFGVSRAAYYAWEGKLAETDPDQERMEKIRTVYEVSHKSYGYRRITIHLQQKLELAINHKAVLRLMNKLGIRSQARKPKMYKKLEEIGTYHRYPNVLNRDFVATKPNQKWVTDVTYIRTLQGWAYLSTIKDLYDGFIVAHVFEQTNSIALVTRTLKQAKQKEKVTDGLILHSDQGTQYTSQPYHVLTNEYNITPSMSRRGNCWDNAPMENFFGHLKEEYLRHFKKTTFKDTEQLIDEYIYFYNYERIQLKTRQTPYQTRCLSS
ncbi:MAG: IS3 family transposase [Anaerolineales bacterium]|nr:IS3 family transposase [Anaerolineales bacterium]MCB9111101.1 IS3 family transposase [Anaerolineales bacterium]MCB9111446.1 IS3 family transposase [Anaerolineales bacterium]MCB9111540.1 IS3 family transposase [Anaerolineales bacterium]